MKYNLLLLLFILSFSVIGQKATNKAFNEKQIQPGKIVVKFKKGKVPSENKTKEILSKVSFEVKSTELVFKDALKSSARSVSKSGIDITAYRTINVEKGQSISQAIEELGLLESVDYAEPIYMREYTYTPNDPELSAQTYLSTIKAEEGWDLSQGSEDVIIAIIDSGVDYEHDDLKDKLYKNEGEIPDNGIDDDNDGYIDNYLGWDFAGDDFENIVFDNDPLSNTINIDHGTAVAGCAAADTDNGIGVAGIGFNCMFMAIKCSSENDTRAPGGKGYVLNAIRGVLYAADNGAHVINMSYGGTGYSQFEQDIFTYAALEKDVVLVGSAGNSDNNLIQYPAGYDHVISVAATEDNDSKSSFSTFGTWVDMSAPGTAIRTTDINNGYRNINGTSFSSPITAGAAGLLRAKYPDYNQSQIAQLLIRTGDDISKSTVDYPGQLGLRLNIENALSAVISAVRLEEYSLLNAEGEFPEKADKASLSFELLNELSPTSANTVATISQVGGTKVIYDSDSVKIIGAIGTGEKLSFEPFLTFDVPETVGPYEILVFNLLIEDATTDYSESFLLQTPVNLLKAETNSPTPYLLAQGGDFENSDGGFISGANSSAGINAWERGVPTNELTEVNSGVNAWKTDLDGDLVGENYSSVLLSPIFDFSDDTQEYELSFYKSMESATCSGPSAVQLQYSLDGGEWIRLGRNDEIEGINWYNKSPASFCTIDEPIFADQYGWLGNFSNEYTAYNVSFLSGNPEVLFRFVLNVNAENVAVTDDGFMVDDFQIKKFGTRAKFYSERTLTYVESAVQFTSTSFGATSYSWDFGDGTTSTQENPQHSYTAPGTYDVSLTINASSSPSDSTRSAYITVLPKLQAPFLSADGGDFEVNQNYFQAINISGTKFELGNSAIVGKDGTASGDNAWVTGIEEELYQESSTALLFTPEFDFTLIGEYILSFKTKYATEVNWDGFIVEYTTDKGFNWTTLNSQEEDGWYDSKSESSQIFGLGVPIFSGSTGGEFVTKSTDVSFLGGEESVGFRFVFLTDGFVEEVGVAIDDFEFTGPQPGVVVADFSSNLSQGTQGCEGQSHEFKSTSTGSVTAINWDFGESADPQTAEGAGPHKVLFLTAGSNEIVMTATDNQGALFEKKETIVTAATHTPTFTTEENTSIGGYTLTSSVGDSYQWFLAEEAIEGATSQTYNASTSGAYSVEVNVGGCMKLSSIADVTILSLVDISSEMLLYPNPILNSSFEVFGTKQFQTIKWSIVDLSGKILESKNEIVTENSNSHQINIQNLSSGVYIFQAVFNGTHIYTERINKN